MNLSDKETSMGEKLKQIMADVLSVSVSEINDKSSMQNIRDWDSIKHMELIFSIEEQFDIQKLGMDAIASMTSVAEIKRVLKKSGVEI